MMNDVIIRKYYYYMCDFRTAFGTEREVSTHTILDSHKVEIDVNHWMLMLTVPGDDLMPIQGVE